MDREDKKDSPNNNNRQQQQHRFPPLLEQPYYSSSFEQHSATAAAATSSQQEQQQQQQETGAANNNQRMMKAAFHEVVDLAPVLESAESNKRRKLLHDVEGFSSSLTPAAMELRTVLGEVTSPEKLGEAPNSIQDMSLHGLVSPRPFSFSPPSNNTGYNYNNNINNNNAGFLQSPLTLNTGNNTQGGGGGQVLPHQQLPLQASMPMFGAAGAAQLQNMWLQWQLQLANQQSFQQQQQQQQQQASLPPSQQQQQIFQQAGLLTANNPGFGPTAALQQKQWQVQQQTSMPHVGGFGGMDGSGASSSGGVRDAHNHNSMAKPVAGPPTSGGGGNDDDDRGNEATGRPPILLYMSCDDDALSEYQCLVRKNIELFEALPQDVESNAQGRNRPIVLGQVGIRCRHCKNLPPKHRARGAVYYPAKLHGVYQAAQNQAVGHLAEQCNHVHPTIRCDLQRMKDRKSSAGGGKKYWADGVRVLGVFEDTHGLRFEKR